MNSTNKQKAVTKAKTKKVSIGFYNLENLFDTHNDPSKLDDDFTPMGFKNWNKKRYDQKLRKLSKVISKIGAKETGGAPSILGVAEVENKKVLRDLTSTKKLQRWQYGIVHFDSPDERGIDCALLYRKDHFKVLRSASLNVYMESEPGIVDYTRDIVHVYGELFGIHMHILVNHWPSRRLGPAETEHKRISAARHNRKAIESIRAQDTEARIVIMGDFNDDPHSESVKNHLVQEDFYNPMVFLLTRYEGSLSHEFKWFLFDQIILSNNFMQIHSNPLQYVASSIYNDVSLTEFKGKYKGNPFRTYAGRRYLGGYSDHFPVYSIFKLKS